MCGRLTQVIDFGDNIEFTPISGTEQDELSCNWDDIPLDSSNLVIKVHTLPETRSEHQPGCNGIAAAPRLLPQHHLTDTFLSEAPCGHPSRHTEDCILRACNSK